MKVGTAKISPLSYTEQQKLEEEKQHLEDVKREAEVRSMEGESLQGLNYKVEDFDALEKRIKMLRETLQTRGLNSAVQGKERDELEKKEKLLREEYFHKVNPSFSELMNLRPTDGPRYTKMVQQSVKHLGDKQHQALVHQWKEYMRRLEPENPHAADVRRLYAGAD